MNRLRSSIAETRGLCLAELLIALPLMAMLMAAMVALFVSMAKPYLAEIHNMEMRQQIRFALDGIARDITYGDTVQCGSGVLEISTRRESSGKVIYVLDRSKKSGRLMRDSQPVTGTGGKEDISVTEFHFSKWNERTVFIGLKAIHQLTNQEFAVETAAILLNQPGK